ncbi:hypothetical protein PSTG_12750 [Puccinia striiformis f. sp. tritici PST-78]|uniref:Uncharacterized protein n=1 Tax=Puccinia striiformis f. sp. tritici PST-78 TaxID=1165861 RepID=A0A0L0V427_9BASI|nr:hypothetical protein PSTG_12750 [Puccinia striiformis f. sp. tritici PST-78]
MCTCETHEECGFQHCPSVEIGVQQALVELVKRYVRGAPNQLRRKQSTEPDSNITNGQHCKGESRTTPLELTPVVFSASPGTTGFAQNKVLTVSKLTGLDNDCNQQLFSRIS